MSCPVRRKLLRAVSKLNNPISQILQQIVAICLLSKPGFSNLKLVQCPFPPLVLSVPVACTKRLAARRTVRAKRPFQAKRRMQMRGRGGPEATVSRGHWLLVFVDLFRILCETGLVAASLGLLFVGGGFLILIGINIFEQATGRLLGKPLPAAVVSDADLPHVLVQIPVFNEPAMVADCLRSAAALDWPREKLHIQLLDDSTDETSAIANATVWKLRRQGYDISHLRRAERRGYKAGALAAGLARSNAPYVAILDADFRPPPNWLRAIVPALIADPSASFVQSRCEFANYRTNWLTRAQGLMFDAHFVMEQATRFRAGWLFQFNGTGGVWRRAAIEAAGGWLGLLALRGSRSDGARRNRRMAWSFRDGSACARACPRKGFALAGPTATLVERLRAGCPQAIRRGLDGRLAGVGESCRRVFSFSSRRFTLVLHSAAFAWLYARSSGVAISPPICRSSQRSWHWL